MMHRPKRQRLPLTTLIIYMLYQIIFPIFYYLVFQGVGTA